LRLALLNSDRGRPVRAGALAAVLGYRIVNLWLVILTGRVIMLLLGDRPGVSAGREVVTAPRTRNR
jgi:uncharacterized membrane protein YbhN (UPF0104 family)